MKPLLLLHATIVVAGAAVTASAQSVRPESLAYMSRIFRVNDFGSPDNPRYSRDGRWLAFDAMSNGRPGTHIFVVAAKGGPPIAITTGTRQETRPMWTAAGDRLVFYSSDGTGAVMTIGVDPATGHAIDQAKRVTIDSVMRANFDVSPDGRSVAYLTATDSNKFDLRIVPISGGPAKTLATVEGGADGLGAALRFDRDGKHIYFLSPRLDGGKNAVITWKDNTFKGFRARDVKRIPTSGGASTTVFTIPDGLMGVQIDPIADRAVVRDGDHAHVLTLAGDSLATIAWAGFRTVASLGFTPDGSSLLAVIDATQSSIHLVPLDGGPVRVLTNGSSYPWPDYWIGEHIFVSDRDRGVQTLLTSDGTKRTITFDLRKANDGVPVRAVNDDPFPDGFHYIVKALDGSGDTSLFVYDSRTGDGRRIAQKVTGSRVFSASGPGDDYVSAVGDELLYRNVRNGIAELHALDVSGRDRVLQSFPLPKQREGIAFAPGRFARAYERGDTAFVDVTIGSGKPERVLVRPGARMGEMVFNRDGSSLYADVITGTGKDSRSRGVFFSTANVRSLALPAHWVETVDCWHPTWLPNGTGVLEFCVNDPGTKTWVSRIPASGPATPQPLTLRETAIFWDYTMSPDGKYVAVPAEKNSGTNLWRIDLRAATNASRSPE